MTAKPSEFLGNIALFSKKGYFRTRSSSRSSSSPILLSVLEGFLDRWALVEGLEELLARLYDRELRYALGYLPAWHFLLCHAW